MFQHTAARRRLAQRSYQTAKQFSFQHTTTRRRLDSESVRFHKPRLVSTHSRPKAAGYLNVFVMAMICLFQHTAARRRLAQIRLFLIVIRHVSTHSRPKAAGSEIHFFNHTIYSFNTQPPEGGWDWMSPKLNMVRSFNTQPPEGGWS